MAVRGRTKNGGTLMEFFEDSTGQVLLQLDGDLAEVLIPTGAALAGGAGSVTVAAPDGVTLDTGGAGSTLQEKLGGTDATRLAPMAADDLTPGAAVMYVFDVADHATQNVDEVLALGIDVTDVRVISKGTNGSNANTVQVDNGTGGNHISDAISMNGKSAGALVDAASLDPTHYSMIAGATLRIVQTRAGGVAAFRLIVKGFLNGS